jgi:integrase
MLKLYPKRGSPNWYIRGTVRGILVDESSRTSKRSVAESILAQRQWECEQSSIFGRKSTATFLEAAVAYMEAGGERRFLAPLIKHFGSAPLANIDQAAIDHAAKLLYPTATPGTLNRQVYTPVSAVLKFAAKRGMCDFRQIDRPRQPKGRVRWLTPIEADRLIDACSPHLKSFVIFLLYTGCRLSEGLYLGWSQVDLERGEVQFLQTKNGEARGVPLHPRVIAALQALPRRDGAVFRRPDGQPYAPKHDGGGQIKTGFYGACRRAGILQFSPHDCRHTWATWHYTANRDIVSLMHLGGWQSEKMVLRYAHMNVEHLSKSIGALPWEKSGKQATADAETKALQVLSADRPRLW